MEAVLTFSYLRFRRHQQHSLEDAASIAVLEKMQVIFALRSREGKNLSASNSDSPGGVAAVHRTCGHMGMS